MTNPRIEFTTRNDWFDADIYPFITEDFYIKSSHDGDSGVNLKAAIKDPVAIRPMAIVKVPTGLSVAIPKGYEGQVRSRSGLAINHGIAVVNSPGTVDSCYRGEILVGLINLSGTVYVVKPADNIAQLVICPVLHPNTDIDWQLVDSLSETDRGDKGFGSTGR